MTSSRLLKWIAALLLLVLPFLPISPLLMLPVLGMAIAAPHSASDDGQLLIDYTLKRFLGSAMGLQAQGTPWYDSSAPAYGGLDLTAVKEGSTPVINAITAATGKGGWVIVPIGKIKTSVEIVIPTGVLLMGFGAYLAMSEGDSTIYGSIFVTNGTGFDVFSTSHPNVVVKGGGICGIGVDGATDAAHWTIHVYDAVGWTIRNFAMRQGGFAGANGILLDSAQAPQAGFQIRCDDVSLLSGLGFTGGDGLKVGLGGDTNANVFTNLQILGFARGLNFQQGGGNAAFGVWCQSCTIGIRYNSSICTVVGGWLETNTTAIRFDSAGPAVNCVAQDLRAVGNTTLVSDLNNGVGRNRVRNLDGFNVGSIVPVHQPSFIGSGVGYVNPTNVDVLVCIIPGGGGMTVVSVDGTVTGFTAACSVLWPAGSTLAVTFGAPSPTWTWFGMG